MNHKNAHGPAQQRLSPGAAPPLDHLPAGWSGPLPPRPPGADSPTGNRLRKVETKDWIADSLARTFSYGQPPPRYENHLSGTETETHPVSAFVKSTLKGLQVREE